MVFLAVVSTSFRNLAQFSSVSPLVKATCSKRLESSFCEPIVMLKSLIFRTSSFLEGFLP